jgi:hypothetical protein
MRPISRVLRLGSPALLAVTLLGCATSSHVMIGTAHPPISPESVRIYLQPPERYEQVATLDASSQGSFAITSQQNMDKAIARLKEEAAKLGANGVLLQGVEDRQSGAIGTGVGSSSYGAGSSSGAGVGGSFGIYNKAVHGIAVFVPVEGSPPSHP